MKTVIRILTLALLAQALVFGAGIEAQSVPTLEIELEGGIVGQSRNDV